MNAPFDRIDARRMTGQAYIVLPRAQQWNFPIEVRWKLAGSPSSYTLLLVYPYAGGLFRGWHRPGKQPPRAPHKRATPTGLGRPAKSDRGRTGRRVAPA